MLSSLALVQLTSHAHPFIGFPDFAAYSNLTTYKLEEDECSRESFSKPTLHIDYGAPGIALANSLYIISRPTFSPLLES
jgi:hypothetical protein